MAQRNFIIQLQSCVRRRAALKQLMALRAEARSVNHFKEVSYKLEAKVVELTQSLTKLKNDKQLVDERAKQLEAQVQTWTEKFEKMEKKAKAYEIKLQEPTVPQAQWDELQRERDTLQKEYQASLQKLKTQGNEIEKLTAQLNAQIEENTRLQKALEEANERANNAADEAEIAELRNQNAALKAQLTQAMRAPRRRDSSVDTRGFSPAPNGVRNLSPSPAKPLTTNGFKESMDARARSRSPAGKLVNRKARRNSMDGAGIRNKSVENLRKAEQLNKNPRPTSIDQYSAIFGSKARRISPDSVDEDPLEEVFAVNLSTMLKA